MAELGDEERALIELARDAHDPTYDDRVRVRAALAGRLGAAAGLGIAAGLGSSGPAVAATSVGGAGAGLGAGTAVGTTLATKLIATAIILGATVGGSAATVHRLRRTAAHRTAITAPAPSGAHRQKAAAISAPQVSPPGSDREDEEEATAGQPPGCPPPAVPREPSARAQAPDRRGSAAASTVTGTRPPEARRSKAPPPEEPERNAETVTNQSEPGSPHAAAPAARAATPALATEARLVSDALAAMRAGEPARALALFDAHAIFYPQGVLSVECAAERVLALAQLGRVAEARAAADAFLRAHPTSPLAVRLRKRLRALDVPTQ